MYNSIQFAKANGTREMLPGPWDLEADAEFTFTHNGLDCLGKRGPSLHWCGYVRIPEEHIEHFKQYDNYDFDHNISVHGGITFCRKMDDRDGFFLGFDCSHYGDYCPGGVNDPRSIYRTERYCKEEITSLADQITAIIKKRTFTKELNQI